VGRGGEKGRGGSLERPYGEDKEFGSSEGDTVLSTKILTSFVETLAE